ncbi:MAG: DUF308 domain-containing protein [Sulfurovum sp.]|nr:DUF308 domain-containing protein [Sulfurovaceae bacterium]
MWKPIKDFKLIDTFGKNAKIAGVIFIILGFIGILFPILFSYATVVFISWLMLFTGVLAAYFTYVTDRTDWAGWLKSLLLIGMGLYMLFSPLGAIATLGLLFSIYFFMDGFSGFAIASSLYPDKAWMLWTLNGIFSLIIGIIFIMGWPFTSTYLIGLLVGVSLLFDGFALFMGGKALEENG